MAGGKGKASESWSDQYGSQNFVGARDKAPPNLVARIFFPFDVHTLDNDDVNVLKALAEPLSYWILSQPIHLHIIGYADPRGDARYNKKLGLRRANSVKSWLDNYFGTKYRYYSSSATSLGEERPTGDYHLDRRVEVLSSWVPPRPPISLGPFLVKGSVKGPRFPLSNRFGFKIVVGGGVGPKQTKVDIFKVLLVRIRNVRTSSTNYFNFIGGGAGVSMPIDLPGDEILRVLPVWLDLPDFEGKGSLFAGSLLAVSGTYFRFDKPMERGLTTKPLDVFFANLNFPYANQTVEAYTGRWVRWDVEV
jgi:hypothetical protein